MICVRMRGGRLGNQLFQYAFARMIKEKNPGEDIAFDWGDVCPKNNGNDGFENALSYFNIPEAKNTFSISERMTFIHKILWKCYLAFFPKAEYHEMMRKKKYQEKWAKFLAFFGMYFYDYGFHSYPTRKSWFLKDIYLLGTFESDRYFPSIRDVILKEVSPIYPPVKENNELYKHILEENSVAISIRRGDFVVNNEVGKVHNVCSTTYFERAIKRIRELIPNPTFVFFSDDIDWVKENFPLEEKCYYETGNDPVWEKMRLMYKCKHFIISNSTFSWWGQYLSSNPDKIVIAPNRWFNSDFVPDIYQENWELVDVD